MLEEISLTSSSGVGEARGETREEGWLLELFSRFVAEAERDLLGEEC